MSKKNIHIKVSSLGLNGYNRLAEMRSIKLIEMVKLMYQHTMFILGPCLKNDFISL